MSRIPFVQRLVARYCRGHVAVARNAVAVDLGPLYTSVRGNLTTGENDANTQRYWTTEEDEEDE